MGNAVRRVLLVLGLVCACCAIENAVSFAQATDDDTEEPAEPKPEPPVSKLKVFLAYGLALGGFGVCVIGLGATLGKMSYQQSRLTITNLLRANPNQAEQMMKGVQGTYMEGLRAALKLCATTAVRDPKIVPMTTVPAYDAAATGVSMYWKGLLGKIKLGVMALIGGVAICAASGIGPLIPVILLVLGALCYLRLYLYKGEMERDFTRARVEILPEVDRAVVDGRYWFPAK